MDYPPGTIELITARVLSGFGEPVQQIADYELRYGNFIKVRGLSANGYWRQASDGVRDGEDVEKRAGVMCMNVTDNQPSLVGGFADRDAVIHFIEFYLRGKILASVVEPPEQTTA